MKKLLLCVAIAATTFLTTNAQDGERIFKKFKGDVSLGYAAPLGSGPGGIVFAMEPKYALMDKLFVGLRMEGAVFGNFSNTLIYENENAKTAESYLATADYYFSNNYTLRPFAGAGAGVFVLSTDALNFNDKRTTAKFGGLIRAGVEVKHFRLGIEYNFVPGTDIILYNSNGNQSTGKSKNGYVGIKAGFCFGGGPL